MIIIPHRDNDEDAGDGDDNGTDGDDTHLFQEKKPRAEGKRSWGACSHRERICQGPEAHMAGDDDDDDDDDDDHDNGEDEDDDKGDDDGRCQKLRCQVQS